MHPKPKLLVLTHSLELGGAPLILYRLLRSIAAEYQIDVISMMPPGPLKAKLEECGIRVLMEADAIGYNLVLCSTILTSSTVAQIAGSVPVVWWIHEPHFGVRFIQEGKVNCDAFKLADHIVFPTSWQARSVYAPWLGKSRWSVIPPGIEMSRQGRPSPFVQSGQLNLVHLGSIESRKGQDLTVKAVRLLNDPSIRVFFLGRGSLGVEPGERDQFVAVGPVDEETVAAYLEHCDAMVFPTRDDLITLSILEAMSVGTCVLSSDFGPIPEAIQHGRNGLLSPVDDYRVLAGNIAMIKRDPDLKIGLVERARQTFAQGYTFAKHRQSMLDVLTSVMNKAS